MGHYYTAVLILPYHDNFITLLHQISVSISLILIAFFYIAIRSLKDKKITFFKFLVRKPQLLLILKKLIKDFLNYLIKNPKFYFIFSIFSLVLIICWTVLTIPKTLKDNQACLPLPINFIAVPYIEIFPLKKDSHNRCDKIGDFVVRNLNLPGKQLALKPAPEILAKFDNEKDKKKLLKYYGTLNLTNRDLRFANFNESDLTKVDFRGATLDYADLGNANIENSIWRPYENLDKTLNITSALEPNMQRAKLQDANMTKANLYGANMRVTNLQGAIMFQTKLKNAYMNRANLKNTNMRGINLQGAHMANAKIQGADLREANLIGANMVNAKLQGVNMKGAKLQGAKLNKANLQGTNMNDVNLQGAKLIKANLQGADMTKSKLQGLDLTEAKLQGVIMTKAKINLTNFNNSAVVKLDFLPNQLINWAESLPHMRKESFETLFLKNEFLIRMLWRNYQEAALPDLKKGKSIICHSGQKTFLDAGIKSFPKEKCEIERKKIIESLIVELKKKGEWKIKLAP